MSSPDAPITAGEYTTTEKVVHKAGIQDQDDIKIRFVNDAIKAATKFINKALQRTTNLTAPIDADLELCATLLAAAWMIIELKDQDKDYTDYLNTAMMILTQFTKTDSATLLQLWGFMFVSSGNTRPTNPDADPFISMNQPW